MATRDVAVPGDALRKFGYAKPKFETEHVRGEQGSKRVGLTFHKPLNQSARKGRQGQLR